MEAASIQWELPKGASVKERFSNYIKNNQRFDGSAWETIRLQIYFAFAQGTPDEIIHYFFDTDHPILSVDLEVFRLLAHLYSLDAVKKIIEQPQAVTLGALHDFIHTQEQALHPETRKPLTDENAQLLKNLLAAVEANDKAHDEYNKKILERQEEFAKSREEHFAKSLEYEREIANLREQLAAALAAQEQADDLRRLQSENDRLKSDQKNESMVFELRKELEETRQKNKELSQELEKIKDSYSGSNECMDDTSIIPPEEIANAGRPGLWKILKLGKGRKERLRYGYMVKLLQNKDYPAYQLQFLKTCYSEGMTIEEMQALEQPGLPLANLQMLKSILLNARG